MPPVSFTRRTYHRLYSIIVPSFNLTADTRNASPTCIRVYFSPPAPSAQLMREALGEVQARIVADDTAGREGEDSNDRNSSNAAIIIGGGSSSVPLPGDSAAARPLTVKGNAHVRITHLPPLSDLCKPNISAIRGTDLGSLIQIQVGLEAWGRSSVACIFECRGGGETPIGWQYKAPLFCVPCNAARCRSVGVEGGWDCFACARCGRRGLVLGLALAVPPALSIVRVLNPL